MTQSKDDRAPARVLNELFSQRLETCSGKGNILGWDLERYEKLKPNELIDLFGEAISDAALAGDEYERAKREREGESAEWKRKNAMVRYQILIWLAKKLDKYVPRSNNEMPKWLNSALWKLEEIMMYWTGFHEEDSCEYWEGEWNERLNAAAKVLCLFEEVNELFESGKDKEALEEIRYFFCRSSPERGGSYIRNRLSEVVFSRKINLPVPAIRIDYPSTASWFWLLLKKRLGIKPKTVNHNKAVSHDTLAKILDVEPKSRAMDITFRGDDFIQKGGD